MSIPSVVLQAGREASLKRNHHWIFSGAIKQILDQPRDGDLVKILSASKELLGYGHYSPSNITVRILHFGSEVFSPAYWSQQLATAFRLRHALGLTHSDTTNTYRLVHGEGDGLPGLIIDMYNGHAVIQCHTLGMLNALQPITSALTELYGPELKTIYNKSKESLGQTIPPMENNFLLGDTPETAVKENSHTFLVNWVTGQKTGFFLDQRDNRLLFGSMSTGKSVLNLFSYTGGFSVYALDHGATRVDSVDVSSTAIDILDRNISGIESSNLRHQSFLRPVNEFIQDCGEYDIIVCDPPAFAKSLNKRHQALIGYKNLNAKVLRKVRSGGFLFTFSCSQVMDRELFQQTIMAAALETGRKVKILRHLSQGPDHPINIYHPEGSYLKGLLLYVED